MFANRNLRSSRRCREFAPTAALLLVLVSCGFDRGDRWEVAPSSAPVSICKAGDARCHGALETCSDDGHGWQVERDCPAQGLVCAPSLLVCAKCVPGEHRCDGEKVVACNGDGSGEKVETDCGSGPSVACRDGACLDLCDYAKRVKSNVGCEYWAADLDNAMVDGTHNAAAQQFAIVVSNPQPDLPAHVTIEQDDSEPGQPSMVRLVAEATILPLNLETFRLGPREVDGSPDGEFNTGTGTALTRHAYRVKSQVPIVAYQFNPLENVNVFSNDASLLKPVEALTYQPGTLAPAYVAVGWPQTIASTDDPDTDFSPDSPVNLRAFLTIVATRPLTHVRITPATRVIGGGPVLETPPGGLIERELAPFDVLNLETGGHNADFTSSTIDADQPIVVFSGSEASDAPHFDKLSVRFCCADHLEEQLDPVRTAGRQFVLAHSPSRTQALRKAGAEFLAKVTEPEYFRVVAVSDEGATIKTSLPPPDDTFRLAKRGDFRELTLGSDATLDSDLPIIVGDVQASQEAAGVPRGLPGGDPSLVILPPVEQYRRDYLFLTPDKYSFDFIIVIASPTATVLLDGELLDDKRCETTAVSPFVVYRCQLSFPTIDPSLTGPEALHPGIQNDGVHRVLSDVPVGVLVFGWDSFVSYGYAAGTELEEINVR